MSIKQYTLPELGRFYKVIVKMEREEKAEQLSTAWMGNNLKYEGIKEVVAEITKRKQQPEEPEELTVEEVNKEWRRLAAFMGGV